MKIALTILSLLVVSSTAFANDGGVAGIQVDQIRMRETAIKDGKEVIVKRIAKPSYQILIEGGEAAKLQKILPSQLSVVTGMQPDIRDQFNESFKSLLVYSEASKNATGKAVSISCSDATLESIGENFEKFKVVKTGKSVCTITIEGGTDNPADNYGDVTPFEPKSCK